MLVRGSVQKRHQATDGEWRRNGHHGVAQDAGRPARDSGRCSCSEEPKSRPRRSQSAHSSDEAP